MPIWSLGFVFGCGAQQCVYCPCRTIQPEITDTLCLFVVYTFSTYTEWSTLKKRSSSLVDRGTIQSILRLPRIPIPVPSRLSPQLRSQLHFKSKSVRPADLFTIYANKTYYVTSLIRTSAACTNNCLRIMNIY